MDQKAAANGTIEIPANHAAAYIIGVPCLILAPLVYWQYGQNLFGEGGLMKLFIVSSLGGVVSFACYAGRKRCVIGAFLGLIGGLGAAGLHLFYTAYFEKTSMLDKESALVSMAGAAPSALLLAYILKRDKAAAQASTNPQTAPVSQS